MRFEGFRGALGVLEPEAWSDGWWELALWVPAGYASTKLYSPALPTVAVGFTAVAVALVHHFAPAVVEAVAGIGGLVGGVLAADAGGCHVLVGDDGVLVLMAFGGIMCTSAIVRILGSASLREAARHLLVAAVSLELALSLVTPVADVAESFQGRTSTAVVLGIVLVLLTVIGVGARAGLPLLGAALVVTELVLAITGGPCHEEAFRSLVGLVAFAAVAGYLARQSGRNVPPDEGDTTVAWAGDYDGRGPAPDPEPPRADQWPGRARREPRDADDEYW